MNWKQNGMFRVIALVIAMTVLGAGSSFGAVNTWLGVNTVFSNVANWSQGSFPDAGDNVDIPNVANDPILDASVAIETLSGAAGGTIDLNGYTLTVKQLAAGEFAGNISGAGAGSGLNLHATSTNMLTLSGTNTYAGSTTINGTGATAGITTGGGDAIPQAATSTVVITNGTLTLGASETIQTLSGFAAGQIDLGGFILTVKQLAAGTFAGNIIGAGAGSSLALDALSDDVLTLSGTNSYAGATTLNGIGASAAGITTGGGDAIPQAATSTVVITNGTLTLGASETIQTLSGAAGGSIALAGYALTVKQTTNGTFPGNIIGLGAGSSLTLGVGSTAVLTLSGINTYAGPTAINAGTLLYNAVMNAACNGAVTVASGATLGGNAGTVQGAVTVASGGIVKPGDPVTAAGIGTLNCASTVNFQNGAILNVDVNAPLKDLLAVSGNMTVGATAVLQMGTNTGVSGTPYEIATAGGTISAFSPSLPANWTQAFTTLHITLTYTNPASIPTLNELGIIIMLLMLAGASVILIRRRQRAGSIV